MKSNPRRMRFSQPIAMVLVLIYLLRENRFQWKSWGGWTMVYSSWEPGQKLQLICPSTSSVFVFPCYLLTHSVNLLLKTLACCWLALAQEQTEVTQRDEISALAFSKSQPPSDSKQFWLFWSCNTRWLFSLIHFSSSWSDQEQITRQWTTVASDNQHQYLLSGLRMLLLVSSAFSTSDLSE